MESKMEMKNLIGFFLVMASILLITANISASTTELVSGGSDGLDIEINNINISNNPALIAGQSIILKVAFTANQSDTNVRLKAELEGEKEISRAVSNIFDVEKGNKYVKALALEVPYELRDELSDQMSLEVEIDGEQYKTKSKEYFLTVQRPSFNVDFLSINTPQTIEAGDLIEIDVILRNIGYNELEDLTLNAKIPQLEIEETVFVGDLVNLEELYDDKEDTLSTEITLEIPYNAISGLYALEVKAINDNLEISKGKQISINNDFESNIQALEKRKTFNTGEEVSYDLVIVNPTDNVKLYRIVAESDTLSVRSSETMIAIPEGESRNIEVFASGTSKGEHQINVGVFSGDKLTGSETLNASVEAGAEDAVVILTIVLVIIFIVLLIVLIILLRKKPEKEEFGESYY